MFCELYLVKAVICVRNIYTYVCFKYNLHKVYILYILKTDTKYSKNVLQHLPHASYIQRSKVTMFPAPGVHNLMTLCLWLSVGAVDKVISNRDTYSCCVLNRPSSL